MVSMRWITWRGKRLLAVAYLERITKIGSLDKMCGDEWATGPTEIPGRKERGQKGELRILEDQSEQGGWCAMSA